MAWSGAEQHTALWVERVETVEMSGVAGDEQDVLGGVADKRACMHGGLRRLRPQPRVLRRPPRDQERRLLPVGLPCKQFPISGRDPLLIRVYTQHTQICIMDLKHYTIDTMIWDMGMFTLVLVQRRHEAHKVRGITIIGAFSTVSPP